MLGIPSSVGTYLSSLFSFLEPAHDAVEYATLEWVDWFNNRRLLGPIGHIPPAEAEANYYAASQETTMAA